MQIPNTTEHVNALEKLATELAQTHLEIAKEIRKKDTQSVIRRFGIWYQKSHQLSTRRRAESTVSLQRQMTSARCDKIHRDYRQSVVKAYSIALEALYSSLAQIKQRDEIGRTEIDERSADISVAIDHLIEKREWMSYMRGCHYAWDRGERLINLSSGHMDAYAALRNERPTVDTRHLEAYQQAVRSITSLLSTMRKAEGRLHREICDIQFDYLEKAGLAKSGADPSKVPH